MGYSYSQRPPPRQWTPGGRRVLTGSAKGEFTLWDGTCFNFVTTYHVRAPSPARYAAPRALMPARADHFRGRAVRGVDP